MGKEAPAVIAAGMEQIGDDMPRTNRIDPDATSNARARVNYATVPFEAA